MLGTIRVRGLYSGLCSIFNSSNSKPKSLDSSEDKADKVSKSWFSSMKSWFSSWFSSSSTTHKSVSTKVAVIDYSDADSILSVGSVDTIGISILSPPLSPSRSNDSARSFILEKLQPLISEAEQSGEQYKAMYQNLSLDVECTLSKTTTYEGFEDIPKVVEKDFRRSIPSFELIDSPSKPIEAKAPPKTVIDQISDFSEEDTKLRNIILLSLTQAFGNPIIQSLNELFAENNSNVVCKDRSIKWEKLSADEFKGSVSFNLVIKQLGSKSTETFNFTYQPKLIKKGDDWQLKLDHNSDVIEYQ